MNITLQIDTVCFSRKPTKNEIGALKQRLSDCPRTVTLEQFAQSIVNGQSFTPAVLMGGARAENWSSQQLFCLDIDNEDKSVSGKHDKQRASEPLTVPQVIDRCSSMGLKPALIYETFSSTPEWQKFRIVFTTDKSVNDRQRAEHIQLGLMELFPECDTACKNADRLFFGGKSILFKDDTAAITEETVEKIIGLHKFSEFSFSVSSKAVGKNNKLEDLKKGFDFLGYIRSFGGTEKRLGKIIQVNPCPICGHNDDFCFYPDTNTFMCFGASGNCGGTIIDFLMYKEKIDKKEAIRRFKYELCGISESADKAEFQKSKMIERHNAIAPMNEQVEELPPYFVPKVNRLGEITGYSVSCPLLAEYFRANYHYFWLKSLNNGKHPERYMFKSGVYTRVSDDEIKGIIKHCITDYQLPSLKMGNVEEVFKDLCCDSVFRSVEELDADENIINFENGLLYLDTMELKPHTPAVLSTIQIPCKWNPSAADCPIFNSFMKTLTGNDTAIQRLLLQFMGVALSNVHGYRMKKSLFIVGKGNSGKSQLRLLCDKLLGGRNVSSESLDTYEKSQFGTMSLMSKRLVGSPDMPFMTAKNMDNFKIITGGDGIPIQMKHGDFYTIKFNGLMWNCGNELPRFGGDKGPHVYERFVIVRCDNVIPEEKQDKQLLEKMYAEREAIVVLAVGAVRKVIANGYRYDIPECCEANNLAYQLENSAVRTFYEECCCERPSGKITDSCTTAKLHKVFNEWCKDNNNGHTFSARDFRKEIADFLANGDIKSIEKKSNGNYYYPFTLTIEAKELYSRVYGYDRTDQPNISI